MNEPMLIKFNLFDFVCYAVIARAVWDITGWMMTLIAGSGTK